MSGRLVLWEVDVQKDFMLPGGKLYVPGAEKLIPNIRRLVEAAESSDTLLISSACAHSENDPEFSVFPAHCIAGTDGARIIPEGMKRDYALIPNDPSFKLPANIFDSPQIVIQKQVLDVFSNPHTETLVECIGPDAKYIVFGVVTEFCVQCASKGLLARSRQVFIVRDAIETLDAKKGQETIDDLRLHGARLIDTEEAVGIVLHNPR
ncbi:MAG TPA: isochorismatase family cysteine hydrolase [Candidatus Acidoferrales bacterium]|nr:isochorismatase family cysteine hydrolase [Candidatus Acidoferrales bacterium]